MKGTLQVTMRSTNKSKRDSQKVGSWEEHVTVSRALENIAKKAIFSAHVKGPAISALFQVLVDDDASTYKHT